MTTEDYPDWTFRDQDSDEDSLIEEQAQVLNELRQRRLMEMINRTKVEIESRLNSPENTSGAIVEKIASIPDAFAASMKPGANGPYTSSKRAQSGRSCCF